MDLDLVGYLCGSIDPEERSRTEEALRNDPAMRTRLDRVRNRLAPLEHLREIEPPRPGLADRTLSFITEKVRAQRAAEVRPISKSGEPVYPSWRWRRVDIAVAAGILIVIGGLSVSGVSRVRQNSEVAGCKNNMRDIYASLIDYSQNRNGHFPQVNEQPPHNFAGSFVPMLQEAGYIRQGTPTCPGSFYVAAVPVAGGYAYSLGYRDPGGKLFGLCRDQDADLLPILSDRPQPMNHRGGHNVLYIGGNVRFCTTPHVGYNGDHIFLNQADAIAAGKHRLDTVLGEGHTSP